VAEDQNRSVHVGKKENLAPFLSTDGKISIRTVVVLHVLHGIGKYTEIYRNNVHVNRYWCFRAVATMIDIVQNFADF
jgi:hypothetical protein